MRLNFRQAWSKPRAKRRATGTRATLDFFQDVAAEGAGEMRAVVPPLHRRPAVGGHGFAGTIVEEAEIPELGRRVSSSVELGEPCSRARDERAFERFVVRPGSG